MIDKGYICIVCIIGLLDKILVCLWLEGYWVVMKCVGFNIFDGYEVIGDFEFNGGFDVMC